MKHRSSLVSIFGLMLAVSLLASCGPSQKELLIGRWETDDGSTLEFREFREGDDHSWRNLGGEEQDGVVTISNLSDSSEGFMGTYQLTDKGMLVITIQTTLSPLGPSSRMNLKYLYAIESISGEELVIRFALDPDAELEEYHRSSKSE